MVWKRVLSACMSAALLLGCLLVPPVSAAQADSTENPVQLYHQTVPETRAELLEVWPSNASSATVNGNGGRPHSQIKFNGETIHLEAYINDGQNGDLEIQLPDVKLDAGKYPAMELVFRYARFTDYEYDWDNNIEWANGFRVYVSFDGGKTWSEDYATLKEQRIVGRGYDGEDMAVIYEAVSTDLSVLGGHERSINSVKIIPYGPGVGYKGFAHILSITVNGYDGEAPGLTKPEPEYIPVEEETLRQIVVQHMYKTLDTEWTTDTEILSYNGSTPLYYKPGYLYKAPVYARWVDTSWEMLTSAIDEDGMYTGGMTDKTVFGMDCIGIVNDATSRVTNGPSFAWVYVQSGLCGPLVGGLENDPYTLQTVELIDRYSKQEIYKIYAQAKPGDLLLTRVNGSVHARLVTGNTKVVYSNNGTINGASTITYSDTAGSNQYFWQKPDGSIVTSTQKDVDAYQAAHPTYTYLYGSSCRKDVVITFEKLLETNYLPYTLNEYTEERVEVPSVSIYDMPQAETVTATGMDILLESNYYINNINATVTDLNTGKTLFDDKVYVENDVYVSQYSNSKLDALLAELPTGAYKLAVDVCSGPVTKVGGDIPVTRALNLNFVVGNASPPETQPEVEIEVSGKGACGCSFSQGLVLNVTANETISKILVSLVSNTYGDTIDTIVAGTIYPQTTRVFCADDEFSINEMLAVVESGSLVVDVTTESGTVSKTVEIVPRTPLTATSGALTSGSYYLPTDLTATDVYTVANGQTVDICLHGNTLYRSQKATRQFTVNGELTVRDESAAGSGEINGNGYTGGYCFYVGDGTASAPASVTLLSGTIADFTRTSGVAGAAYITGSNAAFYMKGGTITGCSATNGGALFSDAEGTIQISDGKITGNTATSNGGGVYIENGSKLVMTGGIITENSAKTYGGGVYATASTVTLDGTAISKNTCASGGGIYVTDTGGSLIMDSGLVGENTANTNGGGIYVSTGATGTINGGQISANKNTATNTSYGGGGMCIKGSVTMNGGTISGNHTKINGGGVFLAADTASFHLKGGEISENTGVLGGGGVYAVAQNTLHMSGGTIADNSTDGNGGGVLVGSGSFTQSGGTISGNWAKNGGGVALSGAESEFVMRGGTIGGDTLDKANFLVGTDGSVYGNAVYVDKGAAYLYGGDITGNVSDNTVSITKAGQTIKTANGNGALWVSDGTVVLGPDPKAPDTYTGAQIYANKGRWAGGVWINNAGSLTMTGGTIGMNGNESAPNTASGGSGSAFCLYRTGTANISGGKINGDYRHEGTGTISVSGGKFSHDPTAYLAEGCQIQSIEENGLMYLVQMAGPRITGTVVNLGNSLGIKFYVNVDDGCDVNDYTLMLSRIYSGKDPVSSTVVLEPSDNADAGSYMYYYTGIAAKEMGDEVTLTILRGDTPVSTCTESVRTYAHRLLGNSSFSKWYTTVVDMLNYGAAAQTYFGYNTGDLVNAGLTEEQKAYATQTAPECSNGAAGSGYAGSIVSLQDNIVLKMVFAKSAVGDAVQATVRYTGYKGAMNEYTAPVQEYSADYVMVVVDKLVVADARQLVTCTIGSSCTGTDSVESYAARGEGDALATVTQAMMKFADSARAVLSS